MAVDAPGQLGQSMTPYEFHVGLELLLAAQLPSGEFWASVDAYLEGAAPQLERWIACLTAPADDDHGAQRGSWSEVSAAKAALRLCQRWHEVANPLSLDREPCLHRLVRFHKLHADVHRDIVRALTQAQRREGRRR